MTPDEEREMTQLSKPVLRGKISVEEALTRRRSVREFAPKALSEQELSQLLWAAQGITGAAGLRTAPSAGALYPIELYVATATGFYQYDPPAHRLSRRSTQDLRAAICHAALNQEAILQGAAVFVIAAVFARTERKYGAMRTPRYVHMEAGHVAQNLLLQAVGLGLGAVPIGAFYDSEVRKVLTLPSGHEPLYLIPVGHPR